MANGYPQQFVKRYWALTGVVPEEGIYMTARDREDALRYLRNQLYRSGELVLVVNRLDLCARAAGGKHARHS